MPLASLRGLVSAGKKFFKPDAPTALQVNESDGQLSLSWVAPSQPVQRYFIRRGVVMGGPYPSLLDATDQPVFVSGTTYVDNDVTNGTSYYYVLIAENAAGQSGESGEGTGTPTAGNLPPDPPTSLVATLGADDASADLTWIASPNTNTYTVWRSTTQGGPYSVVASGIVPTSYTDPGLAAGTTFYYVITAVNSFGESGFSNEAAVSTPPPAGSTPINSLPFTIGSPGNYHFNWSGSMSVSGDGLLITADNVTVDWNGRGFTFNTSSAGRWVDTDATTANPRTGITLKDSVGGGFVTMGSFNSYPAGNFSVGRLRPITNLIVDGITFNGFCPSSATADFNFFSLLNSSGEIRNCTITSDGGLGDLAVFYEPRLRIHDNVVTIRNLAARLRGRFIDNPQNCRIDHNTLTVESTVTHGDLITGWVRTDVEIDHNTIVHDSTTQGRAILMDSSCHRWKVHNNYITKRNAGFAIRPRGGAEAGKSCQDPEIYNNDITVAGNVPAISMADKSSCDRPKIHHNIIRGGNKLVDWYQAFTTDAQIYRNRLDHQSTSGYAVQMRNTKADANTNTQFHNNIVTTQRPDGVLWNWRNNPAGTGQWKFCGNEDDVGNPVLNNTGYFDGVFDASDVIFQAGPCALGEDTLPIGPDF